LLFAGMCLAMVAVNLIFFAMFAAIP
jgi:hypothetical protein